MMPLPRPRLAVRLASMGAASALLLVSLASAGGSMGATATYFVPLEQERCAALGDRIDEVLEAEASSQRVPFRDPASDRTGFACETVVTGTGADFGSFLDVASRITEALEARDWRQDERYLADGPTGTALGFRDDDALALLRVGWTPAPEAGCPDDVPVFECDVEPEHQEFTVVLTAARTETGPVDVEHLPATLSARQVLANSLGLDLHEIELLEVSEETWPDACLGLAGNDEVCAQVMVPGYSVTLEAGGETYEVRTDALGEDVRRLHDR